MSPDPLPSDEAVLAGCMAAWGDHWPRVPNPTGKAQEIGEALTAAYAIDMPRREAETRAATIREVSAWLEEADPYVARDFAVYLNQEAE